MLVVVEDGKDDENGREGEVNDEAPTDDNDEARLDSAVPSMALKLTTEFGAICSGWLGFEVDDAFDIIEADVNSLNDRFRGDADGTKGN